MKELFNFLGQKNTYMSIITIIIYILIGYIIYVLLKKILIKSLNKKKKREQTLKKLLISIIKVAIIIIEIIVILETLGINVTSLLAGLGIASVVLGLALQDIMKDILSGIFIVIEDQYDVGDLVEINNFTGNIISVGLKSTKIKNYEGKIKIISNRNISEVINYSKSNNYAIIDIPVSYEENISKVEKVLNKIIDKIKELDNIIGNVELLGINELAESSINYRLTAEVKSSTQYQVQRQIRKIVLEEFNKEKINIPYNKIEVINEKWLWIRNKSNNEKTTPMW